MMLTGREYAFIGDAVWALVVKEQLILNHTRFGQQIHIASAHYLSAPVQAQLFLTLEANCFFTEDELAIYKKGRNIKVTKRNSHENITVYRQASGFEAIIGYLYFNGNMARIQKIFSYLLEVKENERETTSKCVGGEKD